VSNLLGSIVKVSSFGESHGPFIGAVIDGFPSNIELDFAAIQHELNRRKPGQSSISTTRKEDDEFNIVSGIYNGRTTGTPICILIPNTNQQSKDYEALKEVYRPGHADFVYQSKYGIRDHRGGGRSSARVTAAWVAAGAIAKQYLSKVSQIQIQSVVTQVHDIQVPNAFEMDWSMAENNVVRCPDANKAIEMQHLIEQIREQKDSVGGVISSRIRHCPIGLGEPLFDKLNANLAKAIFSINAVKGVEFGKGFDSIFLKGSEYNDSANHIKNHEGGINAGLSTGQDILFRTAFKPVSSIGLPQDMKTTDGKTISMSIEGRHDPCVLPRAVPIVEALSALVVADFYLQNIKYDRIMTQHKTQD
jgi:chorismate synthase